MKASVIAVLVLALAALPLAAAPPAGKKIGVNILSKAPVAPDILADLGRYGTVGDVIPAIKAISMQAPEKNLETIRSLPYVDSAGPDAERTGIPIDTVQVANFGNGLSTWNLGAINVTEVGLDNRQVTYDGAGVYVAVLDTGLLDSWRQYFPQERIASEYAKSFSGGPTAAANISEQPNKWEHDQDSHGTHVTSTILGYNFRDTPINGVAPMATVIPVKDLGQNGSGWSSVIAQGIMYVAELKEGPLAAYPVVINVSLGGPALDPMEKAAIDYAISQGVIVVASAGNAETILESSALATPAGCRNVLDPYTGWTEFCWDSDATGAGLADAAAALAATP